MLSSPIKASSRLRLPSLALLHHKSPPLLASRNSLPSSSLHTPAKEYTRDFMANEQIPKTAPAVVFEKCNGPITYQEDHKVTQPDELKPGEVLVKIEASGVCRAYHHMLVPRPNVH